MPIEQQGVSASHPDAPPSRGARPVPSARALLALTLALLAGCSPDKSCETACDHVLACVGTYGDHDLDGLTREQCVAACEGPVPIGACGGCESVYYEESWRCATEQTECDSLDHRCDVF